MNATTLRIAALVGALYLLAAVGLALLTAAARAPEAMVAVSTASVVDAVDGGVLASLDWYCPDQHFVRT